MALEHRDIGVVVDLSDQLVFFNVAYLLEAPQVLVDAVDNQAVSFPGIRKRIQSNAAMGDDNGNVGIIDCAGDSNPVPCSPPSQVECKRV